MQVQFNNFLKKKQLPDNERDFFTRYGISIEKAYNLLIEISTQVNKTNPEIKINHNAAWTNKQLNSLFNFAGHNYPKLIQNIKNYNQSGFSAQKYLQNICKD